MTSSNRLDLPRYRSILHLTVVISASVAVFGNEAVGALYPW
jgi:hypothetical protein